MGRSKGRGKSGQRQEHTVYRIVLGQAMVAVLVAAVLAVFDTVMGYSFLLGGLVSVLPSGYMAWRMSRLTANPVMALRAMMVGEAGKLMMTVMLFAVIFKQVTPLNVPLLFAGLIVALSINAGMPLLDKWRDHRATGEQQGK